MHSQDIITNPCGELLEQIALQLKNGRSRSTVWLDKPYNLYLIEKQSDAYLAIMENDSYSSPFHDPVKVLFQRHCAHISRRLRPPIDLIDLGPGFPDKVLPFFKFFKSNNISCRYVPVDINQHFLAIAAKVARDWQIEVAPQNCLFEELPIRLSTNTFELQSRIVVLGLTFMNYRPESIVHTLSKLIRDSDQLLVATQLLEGSDTGALVSPYLSVAVEKFTFLPLELIGCKRGDFTYFARFRHHRIEIGYRTIKPVSLDRTTSIPEGLDCVVAISYRYQLQEFQDLLKQTFSHVEVFYLRGSAVAIGQASSPYKGEEK